MSQATSWTIESAPSLREMTVKVLRNAILDQTFVPGEKLVERVLADRTGVSRTSIREALSQLEAEGLVEKVPHNGMFVTQLTEADALQIYEAREILESAMAKLFVERANDDHLRDLEEAVRTADKSNSPERAREHAEDLDRVFDTLMEGSGNAVIRQMSSLLRGRVSYLRTITARLASEERRRESMSLLFGILEALKARDVARADTMIRAYVQRSARFAVTVLKQSQTHADADRNGVI